MKRDTAQIRVRGCCCSPITMSSWLIHTHNDGSFAQMNPTTAQIRMMWRWYSSMNMSSWLIHTHNDGSFAQMNPNTAKISMTWRWYSSMIMSSWLIQTQMSHELISNELHHQIRMTWCKTYKLLYFGRTRRVPHIWPKKNNSCCAEWNPSRFLRSASLSLCPSLSLHIIFKGQPKKKSHTHITHQRFFFFCGVENLKNYKSSLFLSLCLTLVKD